MNNQAKISASHLRRHVYIYIRQSTLKQVSEHLESQDLQYQLQNRAVQLGWAPAQVVVIDEDLGKSAISSSERYGFQRLYTDVGLGKVGLILVTNVSRLARNCADWYQLLDLAAHNQVLVSDSDGVYNPTIFADRLLLGIQGAFSEAQWYTMRQQMQAARLNKAQRGELALRLPIGYERLPNGTVIKHPDQQVQTTIDQIFRTFRREGTVRGVLRYMVEQGLPMPRQARDGVGQPLITWARPNYSTVYLVLKLPAYAGAYTFGKRQSNGQPGTTPSRARMLAPEQWQVLRHDTFPAYISWAEYLENQQLMADNWQATRFAQPDQPNTGCHNQPFSPNAGEPVVDEQGTFSAPGKGRALLQGIVYCGHCGRPMRVRYRDKPTYVCEAGTGPFLEKQCQRIAYAHVDHAVVTAFLAAIQPAALDIALATLDQLALDRRTLAAQWQQQLDRARYEVTLARTRYEQVDPTLRLVAAELERLWETKLHALAQLEAQWQAQQAAHSTPLSPAEIAQIRHLAADLPALWAADTTTLPERKRLLRTLIADVTLDRTKVDGLTTIYLRWHGGATTTLTAQRPTPGHPSNPPLLDRVRTLAQTRTDDKIAAILNAEGLVSSWHVKDDPSYTLDQGVTYWTKARVRNFRNKHSIPTGMPALAKADAPRADGLIPARAAARQLACAVSGLLQWYRQGLIPGHQERPGTPIWIHLDETNRQRFIPTLEKPAPGMVPLADAPAHFGLSQAEFTTALHQQSLFAWRIWQSRSVRWFIATYSSLSALPADPVPL